MHDFTEGQDHLLYPENCLKCVLNYHEEHRHLCLWNDPSQCPYLIHHLFWQTSHNGSVLSLLDLLALLIREGVGLWCPPFSMTSCSGFHLKPLKDSMSTPLPCLFVQRTWRGDEYVDKDECTALPFLSMYSRPDTPARAACVFMKGPPIGKLGHCGSSFAVCTHCICVCIPLCE